MNGFKRGDIIKRKNVIVTIGMPMSNHLITEVLKDHDDTDYRDRLMIVVKDDKGKASRRLAKYFDKASKRETFLYHILGPYVSEEE